MFWAGPGSQPGGAFVWVQTCWGLAHKTQMNCKNRRLSPPEGGVTRAAKDTWMCWAPPAAGRGKQLDERGSTQHRKHEEERKTAENVIFWLLLTLQSRCSRLWSEAHFRWSSESSSTWLSRLKCSRASFSCISRTCSSCSKEHTFPRSQKGPIRVQSDRKVKCFWGIRSVKIAPWLFESKCGGIETEWKWFALGNTIFTRRHLRWVRLTKSLQFAWVEVIEEVEEASLHLSHVWHICQEGVLQGRGLDDFTGPCWLWGPRFLLVRSE